MLDARGRSADQTDEAVAVVEVDGEVVAEISRRDWYRRLVWRPDLLVQVLEVAESSGADGVSMLLGKRNGWGRLGGPPG